MIPVASWLRERISRRAILAGGVAAASGSAILAASPRAAQHGASHLPDENSDVAPGSHNAHGAMVTVGEVDYSANGFDPASLLTDWETGVVSTLPDGRRLRTFEVVAEDKEIEIAPGVKFPAWTYNGRVPGPTLRATEGDRLRIVFKNFGSHPHSKHFHGIHCNFQV